MKKIFIIGGYCCLNPGDEAILKSTIYRFQDLYGAVKFFIWSYREDFRIEFDREINFEIVYWQPFPCLIKNDFLLKICRELYLVSFSISRNLISWFYNKSAFIKVIQKVDAAVVVGGGYLNSHNSIRDINFLLYLLHHNKKSFYLLGQTIGPFNHHSHVRMAREIFRWAQKIVVREEFSLDEISEERDKVLVSYDDAITFAPLQPQTLSCILTQFFPKLRQDKTVYIGLNLRHWGNSRDYYGTLAQEMKKIAECLPDSKVKFIFVPMEVSKFCDDSLEASILMKYLDSNIDFKVVDVPLTVEEKFYIFKQFDLFVSMRLHGLVFALAWGVPAFGLYQPGYYATKLRGVLKTFNLEDCAIPFEKIECLGAKVLDSLMRRESIILKLKNGKVKIISEQDRILQSILEDLV